MTHRPVTDLAASVRRRLYNLALEGGVDYNSLLVRFTLERLLFRLGTSSQADAFVIKGAMLFVAWMDSPHRSTRDLDLMGFGRLTLDSLRESFQQVCTTAVPDDGLRFDVETISVEEIREQQEYAGFRLTMNAHLGTARIPLQVDIGVGDSVVPEPEMITYPTLLEFPPPRLRAYTRESLVAEKTHAIITLGIANSRMKDLYDIWALCHSFPFAGSILLRALTSTFEHRGTPMPAELPAGLTDRFAQDRLKQAQWDGFRRKLGGTAPIDVLPELIKVLREFLWPVLRAASASDEFEDRWVPGRGWGPPNQG
jgi:predicted nucleotidyltransferase component of viral defense system